MPNLASVGGGSSEAVLVLWHLRVQRIQILLLFCFCNSLILDWQCWNNEPCLVSASSPTYSCFTSTACYSCMAILPTSDLQMTLVPNIPWRPTPGMELQDGLGSDFYLAAGPHFAVHLGPQVRDGEAVCLALGPTAL